MGSQRIRSLVASGLLTIGLAACGGPQDPPPGPLSRHFDDHFLATIAVDQRKDELAAKNAYDVAVLEQQKAQADLDAAKTALDLAKNERDKANTDVKSAEQNNKAAQGTADLNKMKEADTQMKAADSAKAAADARVDYLAAYQKWLLKLERYTEHNMYWKESLYELAQAKVAAANSIQPSGFRLEDYQNQEQERSQKAEAAKQKSEEEKQNAMEARNKWLTMQKSADALLGHKSDLSDPMAAVQGVNYNIGGGVQNPTVTDTVQNPADGSTNNGGGGGSGTDAGSGSGGGSSTP